MKRSIWYISLSVAALIVFGFATAYATPPVAPEPGSMAILGAVVAGGLIARKILKRK